MKIKKHGYFLFLILYYIIPHIPIYNMDSVFIYYNTSYIENETID